MTPVEIHQGSSPVILGMPHTGTEVPPEVWEGLNEEGRRLRDTDWHIHRLYDGLLANATTVRATFHRYCVDANRDPTGKSLYPGQNTTGLIPLIDFDERPIWREGMEPGDEESAHRVEAYHRPYHEALGAEVARVKAEHGVVVLYDCHSIRSVAPYLFSGTLPDFNIGTNNGTTCAQELEAAATSVCAGAEGYSVILNGRFRGGWTTRHYGRPAENIHALQMELTQSSYLHSEAPPFAYDPGKAERVRLHLRALLKRLEERAYAMSPGDPQ
jgi:formiminoglutamase